MAYLGTKPANQVIDSTLIADGTITPSDLSTGKPVWDTNGNVGIGTSSPAFAASRNGLVVKGNTTNGGELIVQTSVDTGSTGLAIAKFGNEAAIANRSNGNLAFATNDTTRMVINSAGEVLVGTSSGVGSNTVLTVGASNNSAQMTVRGAGISYPNAASYMGFTANSIGLAWTSPNIYASVDNATYAVIGTVSDYRLKANESSLENGLETVLSLRPITYNPVDFDGTVNENKIELGLIAHEVQAVRPSVVTGVKDAVNEESNPRYQSVNYAGLVPDLIKAIQEQQAIITELKTRIEALEQA